MAQPIPSGQPFTSTMSRWEDEAGGMDKPAQGTTQESRRLRPAVADGDERVLSKDMLQSRIEHELGMLKSTVPSTDI
eukprot:1142905-Pelagomonas_calceolata.AAC.2